MLNFLRFLGIMLGFSLLGFMLKAQPIPPNCPPALNAGYTITGDSISFCLDGVNLTVNPFSTIYSTDSYAVNQIPYNPYPWVGANPILVNIDDIWSNPIQLPFDFCYFGQKYNSVIIGANGQVSFEVANGGLFNAWASSGQVAPINNAAMNNSIMAPYHDVDPSVFYPNKNITWDIYGTAPCRYMVISWDSIPMFSCNNILASQQIVLFESTYLIDINIKEKTLCPGWNGGVAHQGVQNAAGTVAFMVPGRNGTQWTATNDSWRFTPAGLSAATNLLYTWKDVNTGAILGTGPTLSYFPVVNSKVTVEMTVITACDTLVAADVDTVEVIVTGSVTADFTSKIKLGCKKDTVEFTNISTTTIPGSSILYQWDFGDGTGSTDFSPTHIYNLQNIYQVRLIASQNGCLDTLIQVINLNHPIDAVFNTISALNPPVVSDNDSTCLGTAFDAFSLSIGGGLKHEWNWGDGTINSYPFGTIFDSHTYPNPGYYTLKLTVTDTLGCIDTAKINLFVDAPGFVDMTVSETDICVGSPIFLTDTVAPNTINFVWDFGDGKSIVDTHNPVHVYDNPNTYQLTLTGNYLKCPPVSVTKTVTVDDYPAVNLGKDSMICPGLTQPILVTNLSNPGSLMSWSTGENAASILVTNPGYYWGKATSTNGKCTTTDSIWIKRDCYLNIPNSFSPNGDGMNDYFMPRDLLSSGLYWFKMNVFNRWGEEIFATTIYNGRGWDGKYDGRDQPMGVYVYTIDVIYNNGITKTFKGNVTLLR